MTLYRYTWWLLVYPVLAIGAIAGLVVADLPMLSVLSVLAAGAGGFASFLDPSLARGRGSRAWWRAVRWGVGTAAATSAAVSLLALLGALAWPVLAVAGLTHPAMVRRATRRRRRSTASRMSDHELCLAWQASTRVVSRAPSCRWLELARRRQAYLDEMDDVIPPGSRPGSHQETVPTTNSNGSSWPAVAGSSRVD